MRQGLRVRKIKIPHFAYEFSIPRREHSLSNTSNGGFLLLLHALEVGSHLPLHPFFCSLLHEYGIALGQLCGFSWWIVVSYFIDCLCQNKASELPDFQSLYMLKAQNRRHWPGFYYFSPRKKCETIIVN
ncbi:hypothetical protein J1N35_001607 [Gossypium stocksii]|uniref:Transposase (putative) gypsy type domain-containing protein n=1 Tax=Gossypium stocksii TaxID=47602 RepID=A0A9D3WKE3_9ROSI|nr:hypothetical protein J1N35_001607 [Gossypium stocksii]